MRNISIPASTTHPAPNSRNGKIVRQATTPTGRKSIHSDRYHGFAWSTAPDDDDMPISELARVPGIFWYGPQCICGPLSRFPGRGSLRQLSRRRFQAIASSMAGFRRDRTSSSSEVWMLRLNNIATSCRRPVRAFALASRRQLMRLAVRT